MNIIKGSSSSYKSIEHEKLEYIHSVIQECLDSNNDMAMLETALEFVEDIREPYFKDRNIFKNIMSFCTQGFPKDGDVY